MKASRTYPQVSPQRVLYAAGIGVRMAEYKDYEGIFSSIVSPVERGRRCASNASWTDGMVCLSRAFHPVRRTPRLAEVIGGDEAKAKEGV